MTDFKSEAAEELERVVEGNRKRWSLFFVLMIASFFSFRIASWLHRGHTVVGETVSEDKTRGER